MSRQDYTPESQLLYYYSEGVPRHAQALSEDAARLCSGIRNRKLHIYFPFFWNHDDVLALKMSRSVDFDPEKLLFVAERIAELVLSREQDHIHWIERINLFHMFGLVRIYGKRIPARSLAFLRPIGQMVPKSRTNSLFLVSAINAQSVIENRDPKDETEFFSIAEAEPSVVRDFGNYQIFYHGGIRKCIDELRSDLKACGKVPVPGSVLSLLLACDLRHGRDEDLKPMVYDALYSGLPEKTKTAIDRLYKQVSQKLSQ